MEFSQHEACIYIAAIGALFSVCAYVQWEMGLVGIATVLLVGAVARRMQ